MSNVPGKGGFQPANLPAERRAFFDLTRKLLAEIAQRMRWLGPWAPGAYDHNDVVRDGAWTMVCASPEGCVERPSPQPEGDPVWLLDTAPAWATDPAASYVLTGYKITVPDVELFEIERLRIWTGDQTDQSTYRVGVWNLETGEQEISNALLGDATTDGWLEVVVDTEFLPPGSTWVIGLISQLGGTPTTFSHPWTYMGNLANPDPLSGEVWRRQATIWRFNKFDLGGVDRSSVFEALVPGARFRVSLQEDPDNWRQSLMNGFATYYPDTDEYQITDFSTDGGGPNGNLSGDANGKPADVLFDLPGLGPTPYLSLANGVAGFPNVEGFLNSGFPFNNPVDGNEIIDDTAYGIDLEFQKYIASDEWQLVAVSKVDSGEPPEVDA